jgi:hypothetical protein
MRDRGPPERSWRALARVLALLALLLARGAAAEGPAQLQCRAERAGERTRVEVTAADLFDRDLLHLVRLGLDGRIAVDAVLYRRRPFWFDQREDAAGRASLVTWSRSRGAFALDGQAVDPARLTLPPLVLRADAGGAHYVEVRVRLEVVTAGSLVQVARWLVHGQGEGATPSVLGRSLLSQVAADLARTAITRCPVR